MVDTIDELSDRRNEGVALNLAMGIDRDEVLNAAKELVQSLSTQPAVLLSIWQHRGLGDRKSTRLNSSHPSRSRMPSSA